VKNVESNPSMALPRRQWRDVWQCRHACVWYWASTDAARDKQTAREREAGFSLVTTVPGAGDGLHSRAHVARAQPPEMPVFTSTWNACVDYKLTWSMYFRIRV